MIFELGWAALAAIFTFSIAMVVWGRKVMAQLIFSSILDYLNLENLNRFLIIGSFFLLIFITIAVIYISFVSWKDKRRIDKN